MRQHGLCVTLVALAVALPLSAAAQSQTLPDDYRFATGLYKQQRWSLAADGFRKFLEKYPDHERVPYARLYLGLALVNADKFSDAGRCSAITLATIRRAKASRMPFIA